MVLGLVRTQHQKLPVTKNHEYLAHLLKNDDIFTKYHWQLVVGKALSFKPVSKAHFDQQTPSQVKWHRKSLLW